MANKTADMKEYKRQWRLKNIERVREYHREWNKAERKRDPSKQRAALKRSREKHYDKRLAGNRKWTAANPVAQERIRLASRYGLTLEQYDDMLVMQAGRCWICDSPMILPFIDHCHRSGKVRGLLCCNCNSGLGMFRDNPAFLQRAIAYLEKS